MKLIKTLLLVAAVLPLLLSSCSNAGKEYKVDKEHNVFYKGEGLDESTAKKMGEYLKGSFFTDGHIASVQLVKSKETKDTVYVNYVVDKSKLTPDIESQLLVLASGASSAVFSNAPVSVGLIDSKQVKIKDLGPATARNRNNNNNGDNNNYTNNNGNNNNSQGQDEIDPNSTKFPALYKEINGSKVYYNSAASSFIPTLIQYLQDEQGFFKPSNVADIVFLAEGTDCLLKIPFRTDVLNNSTTMGQVEDLAGTLNSRVLSGNSVNVWACDLNFNPVHRYSGK